MKKPTTVTMASRDHDAFIEAAFSRALLSCNQREGLQRDTHSIPCPIARIRLQATHSGME